MFARNKEFLSNVYREIEDLIWRLSTHPSIVIWGGNNENEVALGWFSQSQKNR
jgi:beta-mannosidase